MLQYIVMCDACYTIEKSLFLCVNCVISTVHNVLTCDGINLVKLPICLYKNNMPETSVVVIRTFNMTLYISSLMYLFNLGYIMITLIATLLFGGSREDAVAD